MTNHKKLFLIVLASIISSGLFYSAKSFLLPKLTFAQDKIESSKPAVLDQQQANFKLPILIYHYVEYVKDKKDTIRKSLNIQPKTFQEQLQTLKDSGYTFITPEDISKVQSKDLKIDKPIIISFDDGYGDFYTDVFPILKKNNVKAIAYIVPGLLGLKNYMTWNQLKEIAQSGLVELGAHTMHHLSLINSTQKAQETEINESKLVLELSLGKQITAFAYPYGKYNEQTIDLVKSAGFTSAVTTDEGTNLNENDMFTLKRIHPGARIGIDLLKVTD